MPERFGDPCSRRSGDVGDPGGWRRPGSQRAARCRAAAYRIGDLPRRRDTQRGVQLAGVARFGPSSHIAEERTANGPGPSWRKAASPLLPRCRRRGRRRRRTRPERGALRSNRPSCAALAPHRPSVASSQITSPPETPHEPDSPSLTRPSTRFNRCCAACAEASPSASAICGHVIPAARAAKSRPASTWAASCSGAGEQLQPRGHDGNIGAGLVAGRPDGEPHQAPSEGGRLDARHGR